MEDLRRAAVAYYNNSSPDIHDKAWGFFQSMDRDQNGRISMAEFSQFLHRNGYDGVDRNWFFQLDANHDGGLDFWELLTFYYVLKTRGVSCAQCGVQLHSLYFTCVGCFDAGHAFDLCSDCYSNRNFQHHQDALFLDSYVLLRSKLGLPGEDVSLAITQPQNGFNDNPRNPWLAALDAALSVVNIATTLAAGCSIM